MKRYLPLFSLLLLLALPAAASATTFGAGVGSDFTSQARGQWSAAQVMKNLNALHRAGGTVARADSDWAGTEPKAPTHGRHHFNWSYDDTMVTQLAQAHLRYEPTLAFAPRWAEGRHSIVIHTSQGKGKAFLPPANNGNFAYYASAFMKRYGPHGAFWKAHRRLQYLPVVTLEVWNEPDNLFDWGQHISLSAYVRMYESVRAAIHRVDRHARVMTGGLAWTESSLPRLLRALSGQPVDAIAIHPYGSTPAQSVRIARDALAIIRAYGRGRTPVSANEYGWTSVRHTWGSTNPRHVKPYAYQTLIGLSHLRLFEILPFSWSDPSWGLSTGSYAQAIKKIRHHR